MQTFVPSVHFPLCALWLDRKRLGKQRVESLQILRALRGISKGWRNHPATRMWEGCEDALVLYSICMCSEWIGRGYEDSCYEKLLDLADNRETVVAAYRLLRHEHHTFAVAQAMRIALPDWWDGPIHASHRASLLSRDFDWYRVFGWPEQPSDDPLYWPVALLSQ